MCMDPIRTRVHSEIRPYAVIQSPNPALCCDSDSLQVRVRGYAVTRSLQIQRIAVIDNPSRDPESGSESDHTARFFASRAAARLLA
jgi:hypothetical protein